MIGAGIKVALLAAMGAGGAVAWSHAFAKRHSGRMPPMLHDALVALPDPVSARLLAISPTLRAEFALAAAHRANRLAMGGLGVP